MGQISGTATHPRKTGGHPPGSSARITWRLALILIILLDRDDLNFVFVLCSSCDEVWSIHLAWMIITEFMLRAVIKVIGGTIFRILRALQPSEYRYLQTKEKETCKLVSFIVLHIILDFGFLGSENCNLKCSFVSLDLWTLINWVVSLITDKFKNDWKFV